jgi:response regulator NasT
VPDAVIAELDSIDGATRPILAELCKRSSIPLLVVTDDFSARLLERLADLPVDLVLPGSIQAEYLQSAVALAVGRCAREKALLAEVAELRQQLADRKLIERAKGIVMRLLRLGESDAFRSMRKLSSDRNLKLVDLARKIVDSASIFDELEQNPDTPGRGKCDPGRF